MHALAGFIFARNRNVSGIVEREDLHLYRLWSRLIKPLYLDFGLSHVLLHLQNTWFVRICCWQMRLGVHRGKTCWRMVVCLRLLRRCNSWQHLGLLLCPYDNRLISSFLCGREIDVGFHNRKRLGIHFPLKVVLWAKDWSDFFNFGFTTKLNLDEWLLEWRINFNSLLRLLGLLASTLEDRVINMQRWNRLYKVYSTFERGSLLSIFWLLRSWLGEVSSFTSYETWRRSFNGRLY